MIITIRLYEAEDLSEEEEDNIERAIMNAIDASFGGTFDYEIAED